MGQDLALHVYGLQLLVSPAVVCKKKMRDQYRAILNKLAVSS